MTTPTVPEPEPCPFCKGAGRCVSCGGKGHRVNRRRWPLRDQTVSCRACYGSGECRLCHGTGKRTPESET